MDYTKGFTAAFKAAFIDPETWNDIGWFDIVSGSVNRTNSGLRQSATINTREYDGALEHWIRIYLDSEQNGARARTALFTGIITSPSDEYTDGVVNVPLQGYSVLKASEDIILPLGWYAPAGANVGRLITELLRSTPAPLVVDDTTATLTESIVAESNENCQTMTDKILDIMGWKLQINGYGEIRVSPRNSDPVITLGAENDVIETAFSRDHDFFGAPNYLRVTSGEESCVAVDESDGALSVGSRGREVQTSEDVSSLTDNETLQEYTLRRLRELQGVSRPVQYTRRYLPDINVEDVIAINYSKLNGTYLVTDQTITLAGPPKVSEVVEWIS